MGGIVTRSGKLTGHHRSFIRLLVATAARETTLFAQAGTEAVNAAVAADIERQIWLLPAPLRLAVAVATTVFNLEPVLRHGRTFARLPEPRRLEQLKRWEHSRLGAKRDFVRYVRSLALLNLYDHPDARANI